MHIAMVEKIRVTLPGIAQLYSSACQEWLGPAEIARRFASVAVQCTKELLMVLQVPMYETLRRLNLYSDQATDTDLESQSGGLSGNLAAVIACKSTAGLHVSHCV